MSTEPADREAERRTLRRATAGLAAVMLLLSPLLFVGLRAAGFADHEGRYAAVAWEMLRTGDWVTPRLNGEVFLNKPPLMFWLAAGAFRVLGPNETARGVSGVATLVAALVLFGLGRLAAGPGVGFWSAAVFLTATLTAFEGRQLRPDTVLVMALCLSLLGAVRISLEKEKPDRLGVAALWGGAGVGAMAKGLLGLLLPALALLPALLLAGRLREARRYVNPGGLLLFVAIALPWHIAAGLATPGFWWDYVVNQHLLFFFDRKFPRDSVPHPLGVAWGALALRLFPWVLLLPVAAVHQFRVARASGRVCDWLPLTWFGAVWLFFSLSRGRLEHHFLPAVPAAALLTGRLCSEWSAGPPASGRRRGAAIGAALVLAGVLGLALAPLALRRTELALWAPEVERLTRLALAAVIGAGAAALALACRGRAAALPGLLAAAGVLLSALAVRSTVATEPLFSVRPLVSRIPAELLERSEIAYEAGQEYQLCGAIAFYLRRRLLLLEPPGFVPPTYLRRDVRRLFVPRARFRQLWERGERRYLLFSDPEKPAERPDEFPRPWFLVARIGRRVVLTNRPVTP